MQKIKDRILLGIIAGVVGGIPGRIINAVEYNYGSTNLKYGQIAASLFLPKGKANSKEGKIIASLTNHLNISLVGIISTYLLSATGRDYAPIKGAGIGILAWTTIYGLISRLNITVKSNKPRATLLSFIDHVIMGVLCCIFISFFGHDSLFPDAKVTNGKKLPLIYDKDLN